MRLLHLAVHDIRGLSFALDPAPAGLTVFTAGTGGGKSTAVEAVTWALATLGGEPPTPALDGAGHDAAITLRCDTANGETLDLRHPAPAPLPPSRAALCARWSGILAPPAAPEEGEGSRGASRRLVLGEAERDALSDALDRLASLEARRRDEESNLRGLTEDARRLQKHLDDTARWDGVTEAQILRADVLAEAWDSAIADLRRTDADLAHATALARSDGDDPDWYARLERRAAALTEQDRGFLERAHESAERLRHGLAEDRDVLVEATEARHTLAVRRYRDQRLFGACTVLGALVGAGAAAAYLLAWVPEGVLDPLTLPVTAGAGLTAMLACGAIWAVRAAATRKRDTTLEQQEDELKGAMRTKAAGVVRIEMRVEELGRQVGLPEGRSLAADLLRAAEVRARFGPLERAAQDAARRRQVAEDEWRTLSPEAMRTGAAPAAPGEHTTAEAARAFATGARRRVEAVREFEACSALKSETKARLSALLAEGGALVAQLQDTARALGVADDADGDVLGALRAALRSADEAAPRAAHSAGERALAALRDTLARAAVESEGDERLPLLLDDPLAACDDDTALTVVADLARRVAASRQVLLFTAHAARAAQWASVLHAAGFPCAVQPLGASVDAGRRAVAPNASSLS